MPKTPIFAQIRHVVSQIPLGKVATYGQIAKIIGTNPRVIGWALRGNENRDLPCHRVVKSGGTLVASFSLGNWPEQRRRLQAEGLTFSGSQIVAFPNHLVDSGMLNL